MNDRRKPARAGGAILALCIAIGTAIGVVMHQSSMGVLAGTGVGLALLALVWVADRR